MSNETRERILQIGAELVHRQGFNNTGLSEILRAAEVPKGSFYFYFPSKEAFGLELVAYHRARLAEMGRELLSDESLPPVQRIRAMFQALITLLEKNGYSRGCPIGNLAQELGDLNPAFRDALSETFAGMARPIANLLRQAKERGEVAVTLDPETAANFIVDAWQGALLRMKADKCSTPLQNFDSFIFGQLLAR